jgi:hypothetical protein
MIRKWIEIMFCVGVPMVAAAAAAAPAPADPGAARLSQLAQVQVFPVEVDAPSGPRPLAPLPEASAGARDSGDRAPQPDSAPTPEIPPDWYWTQEDGLRLRSAQYARRYPLSRYSPGLVGPIGSASHRAAGERWFPAPREDGWTLGVRDWRTRLEEGPEVRLGRSEIVVPEWNEAVPLGGVSLSQSLLASGDGQPRWHYSLALGAVDQSPAESPAIEFGPAAGNLSLKYAYSPSLKLETHAEVAPDLVMAGVTGEYDLGVFGRWRSGVARSNRSMGEGWRYRAMADFAVDDDWNLAWVGERHTEGFMDIRRHASGAEPVSGRRHRWSASWDTGGWGIWSGSFESVRDRRGDQRRKFGMSQQFRYSPNLQVGLYAERELVSDDYDIGLRLSFPLF